MTTASLTKLRSEKHEGLNYVSIGDVHGGNPRIPTVELIQGLDYFFADPDFMSALDLLLIEGDFWDKALSLASTDALLLQYWMMNLVKRCKEYSVIMVSVEGTPSHDRGQSNIINMFASGLSADVKHLSGIGIEYIPSLDIHILYIQDELNTDPNTTWKQVKALMKERGLDKVDITLMHGMMEYQRPRGCHELAHQEKRYISITRYFIHIGHIHTASRYDIILASGSFSRDRHGQEEKKGMYQVTLYDKRPHKVQFLENKFAPIFITLDCSNKTLEESLELFAKLPQYPPRSNIRVFANPNSDLSKGFSIVRREYPDYNWRAVKKDDDPDYTSSPAGLTIKQYKGISVTYSNVTELLIDDRIAKQDCDTETLMTCRRIMAEAITACTG